MSSPEEARLQTIIPGSDSDFMFLISSVTAGFIPSTESNGFLVERIAAVSQEGENEVPNEFRLDFYESQINLNSSDVKRGSIFASIQFANEVYRVSYSPKKVRREIMSGDHLERALLVNRLSERKN